jgi:hypothetical protein
MEILKENYQEKEKEIIKDIEEVHKIHILIS